MGLKLGEWVKYRNIRLEMLLPEYETNIYKHTKYLSILAKLYLTISRKASITRCNQSLNLRLQCLIL